ncbi:MAG: hypothetical protein U9Q82_16300 [Chloroflexota bacterium]|nr:hypothetical protein [Chloroflexota bacterium]
MKNETVFTLEQLKNVPVDEFLHLILKQNQPFRIHMPSGEFVIVRPELNLAPLPELDGYVPDNWKKEIYA